MKQSVLPVLLASIWISISEFVRNELLLNQYWTEHYGSLGLTFPAEPVNGAIWGLWSLLFAISLFIIGKRFSFKETIALGWFVGFVLMWVVVGNMGVLPMGIMLFAVPLSMLEVFLAVWLIWKFREDTAIQ